MVCRSFVVCVVDSSCTSDGEDSKKCVVSRPFVP
jgi:hypothetical protein